MGETTWSIPDKWHRRLLRNAVRNQDTSKLRHLIDKGVNMNMVISDAFWDSPLTFAVKCGSLDIVEILLQVPNCNMDKKERSRHTPLDEAVKWWFIAASNGENEDEGIRRFEIIRLLLKMGARDLSLSFLENILHSILSTPKGPTLVAELVHLFCRVAHRHLKNNLLCIMCSLEDTYVYIYLLLQAGATPTAYLYKQHTRIPLPLYNAALLIQASSSPRLLSRIESDVIFNLTSMATKWIRHEEVLSLLVVAGHVLPLSVMDKLRREHKDFYRWYINYSSQPKSLLQLCRLNIRKHIRVRNLYLGITCLGNLPVIFKDFLLLKKI